MKVFFTMCYGDINRFIFNNTENADTMQKELNTHAQEEDFNWQWMLADVEQLGLNEKRSFTDTVMLKTKNQTINFDAIIEKSKKFKFDEVLGDYSS